MKYITTLGNQYMVADLQYFLSGVSLHQLSGIWQNVTVDPEIHYFDARIPASLKWLLIQQFQEGAYDSLRFIFGINEKENVTGLFTDPPERDMFWPVILGGGYHYMKMNLKWKNAGMTEAMPFMFHIGIGQMYTGNTANTDSIIGFIQNYFRVTLPVSMKIEYHKTTTVGMAMNINKWFDSESAFDFAEYPMGIMQDQGGMYKACQNGKHVFSVHSVSND
jgi:hypothetical protein